jgi:hypothetical protein
MTAMNLILTNKPHVFAGKTRTVRGRRPTYKPLLFAMYVICTAEARKQAGERTSLEDLVAQASEEWSISEETGRSYVWNNRYSYSAALGLVSALLRCPGIKPKDILFAIQRHMPRYREQAVTLAPNAVEFNVNPYLRSIHSRAGAEDESDEV